MNDSLVETMRALRPEPTRSVDLYRELYNGSFIVLVQAGSEESPGSMLFLTYPAEGGQQLPVFTYRDYILTGMRTDAIAVSVDGPVLWPRLLEIIGPETCTVEVDPGQPHGIRLLRNMVLGMVAKYGEVPS
jgi:hypothetical protein